MLESGADTRVAQNVRCTLLFLLSAGRCESFTDMATPHLLRVLCFHSALIIAGHQCSCLTDAKAMNRPAVHFVLFVICLIISGSVLLLNHGLQAAPHLGADPVQRNLDHQLDTS